MMRLDKYLCESNIGTRSQVKALVRQGQITVNGIRTVNADIKIDEKSDKIICKGQELVYKKYVYYMLNKPAGVVSATQDNTAKTVTDLLKAEGYGNLFPVGRLDKDTEGLLLLTNDGNLAHNLLSPTKHVKKTYYFETDEVILEEMMEQIRTGVSIGDEKPTRPAEIESLTPTSALLSITEGRYHQVKRMLQAVGRKVCYLKRLSMGSLHLDESLKSGEYRELTKEEINRLMSTNNKI